MKQSVSRNSAEFTAWELQRGQREPRGKRFSSIMADVIGVEIELGEVPQNEPQRGGRNSEGRSRRDEEQDSHRVDRAGQQGTDHRDDGIVFDDGEEHHQPGSGQQRGRDPVHRRESNLAPLEVCTDRAPLLLGEGDIFVGGICHDRRVDLMTPVTFMTFMV